MKSEEEKITFEDTLLSKSKYYPEGNNKNLLICDTDSRRDRKKSTSLKWSAVLIPGIIKISPILECLRSTPFSAKEDGEGDEEELDILKDSLIESEKIEIVRKKNFFSEEVTENEQEIIAQRVALQQRQFAAFESRERKRKSVKIRKMFDYISDEEIIELLLDCDQDEGEVIYRLTKPGYLRTIRKSIALKYTTCEEKYPSMSAAQRVAYDQLLKKRSETLRKTTNDHAKKQYKMCNRLGLDEALQQAQNNSVDPEKAFEGWSEARIKSYRMIDQNPNSYYYRFNAPGEVQQRGQWNESEKNLFYKRLEEVGANGQWGIFAMTIPGRVGYQCSNFYRLLVETKTVNDPNYVLDSQGKARYLFDKKNADGKVQKAFRTHTKLACHHESSTGQSSRRKKTLTLDDEDDNSCPIVSSTSKPLRNVRQQSKQSNKRRRKQQGCSGESDADISDLHDDDYSGDYSSRALRSEPCSVIDSERKSKRQRYPTKAAIEAGLIINDHISWKHQDDQEDDTDPTCPLPNFIDPITLDQVIKPAISKYGHVMGYDSWIRCLNNWEGKRNICPLTKNPLTKRDLVLLTLDNLEEYKDSIVNY